MDFSFKKDFSLGVAAAATQIEGGDCHSNWNDWYNRGRIKDHSDPAVATDHYERWKEDADLMKEMEIPHYRMGIEWAKICPTEGEIDKAVIEHYREEITYLKAQGTDVLMTIHHFTNPMWFEDKGGFEKRENMKYFLDYVELVVDSFGDLVSEYITINEPNVYATNSYYFGIWPPGVRSFKKTMEVMSNMAVCHIRSYDLIHHKRRAMGHKDTKVSFANHMRAFAPQNSRNAWHRTCSRMLEFFFQGAITRALMTGEFPKPLKGEHNVETGTYSDFIAINYYTRSTVSGFGDGIRKMCKKNDLGWEIYPQGLIQCAQKAYDIRQCPIYITESGTCDNHDVFRCKYIYHHLNLITRSDLPIRRYYHWCFCDNFEWIEGESARFGLVHVDYATQKRTIKKSGEFYTDMIRHGGITKEAYEKYVKPQKYHD